MIQLYEKELKSVDNPYGIKEVDPSVLLKNPCMICLSAQPKHAKSVFGIIRVGMMAARLRTSQGIAAGYNIKDFPVKFLGVSYKKDNLAESQSEEMAKIFRTLVTEDNEKLSIDEAKRNVRNITFMTYCDGTYTYLEMEKSLADYMKTVGYSEVEVHDILSQIAVVPIQTDRDYSNAYAQFINFQDINDLEVELPSAAMLNGILNERQSQYLIGRISDEKYMFFYKGSGKHSLKDTLDDTSLALPCLSTAVSMILRNSINNHDNPEKFTALDLSDITKNITKIIIKKDDGLSVTEIQKEVDSNIRYKGAKRISVEEDKLLQEIDKMCAALIEARTNVDSVERTIVKKDESISQLQKGISEYCSPMTVKKISRYCGYQYGKEEVALIESSLSDKEIVANLEKQKENTVGKLF